MPLTFFDKFKIYNKNKIQITDIASYIVNKKNESIPRKNNNLKEKNHKLFNCDIKDAKSASVALAVSFLTPLKKHILFLIFQTTVKKLNSLSK